MKKINIKNYTSSIGVDSSISRTEKILVSIGATNIMKQYDPDGRVAVLAFSIKQGENDIPFRLPAKVDQVKKLFLSQYKYRPTKSQIKVCEEQAQRTAWKNICEWVSLQATMIQLDQVEVVEVFMPYMYNLQKGQTLYQIAKENNYQKLLT